MTAARLRALHVPGEPLLLPNAWDADTAQLVEETGFPVVATSSVAVAASLGYADGEQAPVEEMLAAAARIARAVSVPVTVDAEAGYRLPARELVERLLETGAVGCNLEDTDHRSGRPRDIAEQADWLASVREAAQSDLVINARIDVFLNATDERAVLPEAIERARAYLRAGADCVYPILLRSPVVLSELTEAVRPAAVNANYRLDGPSVSELGKLGVARVSLGAGLWRATRTWLHQRLEDIAEHLAS